MTKTIAVFHRSFRRMLGFYLLVFLLSACSIVRQPSPEEYESVRQNQKAIVLFRFTGSLDGKEVRVLIDSVGGYPNYVLLSFGLANLEVGEPLRQFPVQTTVASWRPSYPYFSPATEVAESGWGAFLLEPGAYYLRITSFPKGAIEPIPEFRFMVPPNAPLVYIGSLHLACTTFANAGWYGTRGFGWGSCLPGAKAANEGDAAKLVAQGSFKEFGPPFSAIMQRYTSAPLAPATLAQIAPTGLLVSRSKIEVGSPEWTKRAMSLGLLPSTALLGLASGGGGPGAGYVGAFGILWAPLGSILGYLGGKISESSWEPCRQALQESLIKFDPMNALATSLKIALDHEEVQTVVIGAAGAAGDVALVNEVKSVLGARVTRVALRFCSPTLCLDVATRVTLFDATTQTYIYDRVLVYSAAQFDLQPYESFVLSLTTPAAGRELETYCGEGGGEILQADLSNALDAIVNRVTLELGLRVE